MGGVVARLAIRLAPELPVDAIVTIATPHQLPPANLEFGMERLYTKMNTPATVDPLLISICGGVADTQIVSDSCSLPDFVRPSDGFTAFSSGMPTTWTNVEHQAIVWCDQIRWKVARILLDMNAVSSREEKLSAAKRWLQGASTLNSTERRERVATRLSQPVYENMTYIIRFRDPTPTQVAEPPLSLVSCDTSADCEQIAAPVQIIPYPDDFRLPFPLPGEGIRHKESALAISVKLHDRDSIIEIGSDEEFDVLAAGAHLHIQDRPGRWISRKASGVHLLLTTGTSEFPAATLLSFHFPSVLMSSLFAWRWRLITPSCTGEFSVPIVLTEQVARPSRTSKVTLYKLALKSLASTWERRTL